MIGRRYWLSSVSEFLFASYCCCYLIYEVGSTSARSLAIHSLSNPRVPICPFYILQMVGGLFPVNDSEQQALHIYNEQKRHGSTAQ